MIAVIFAAVLMSGAQQTPPPPVDAPLSTPAATTPPEVVDEAQEARLNERVCRNEAVVGTRFGGQICMTRREWNQRRDESRRLAHRLESGNSRQNSPPLATTTGR
jgi:hypothetical protein